MADIDKLVSNNSCSMPVTGCAMSAIITGEACKECGRKYWVSLGHPKWYDDVMKRREPKGEDFLFYENMVLSGKCPNCFLINKMDFCGLKELESKVKPKRKRKVSNEPKRKEKSEESNLVPGNRRGQRRKLHRRR